MFDAPIAQQAGSVVTPAGRSKGHDQAWLRRLKHPEAVCIAHWPPAPNDFSAGVLPFSESGVERGRDPGTFSGLMHVMCGLSDSVAEVHEAVTVTVTVEPESVVQEVYVNPALVLVACEIRLVDGSLRINDEMVDTVSSALHDSVPVLKHVRASWSPCHPQCAAVLTRSQEIPNTPHIRHENHAIHSPNSQRFSG